MITSGSVGTIWLPEITDEIVAETLRRSGNKYEIEVTEELIKKGVVLGLWNNKRKLKFWSIADAKPAEFRKKCVAWGKNEDWIQRLRQQRNIPFWLLDWAFPESEYALKDKNTEKVLRLPNGRAVDRFFHAPKRDAYGLPWGKIEEYDKTQSEELRELYRTATMQKLFANNENFGDSGLHYADIRALYELLEETGLEAVKERKDAEGNTVYIEKRDAKGRIEQLIPVKDSLIERLVQLFKYDRLNPQDLTIEHEVYFYRAREVIGKLKETGTEDEAEAPEYLPLMALNGKIFYPTHAHGIGILLEKVIKEGRTNYQEALVYIKSAFGQCKMLRKDPNIELPDFADTMADDELWKRISADVRPLR